MGTTADPVVLNLGCGFNKLPPPAINVDGFAVCEPDVLWNLNETPYPWDDESVDVIHAWHIFEHLEDWWECFNECARILRKGGVLHIRVPDESSSTALTYRDHLHVFDFVSFHGVVGATHGTSAWAKDQNESVPLKMIEYYRVPFPQYQWMIRWAPWLLEFCARHLRNFIWEQRFIFMKVR